MGVGHNEQRNPCTLCLSEIDIHRLDGLLRRGFPATFSGFQVEHDQPELDTLTVLFEQRELVVLEGGFSDNFCPYEVHIYEQEQ